MARCGAFSGTSRPVHTARPPPGPGCHRDVSTPLGTTSACTAWDQAAAVCRLTAANVDAPPDIAMADSSQPSGGVCSVVTIGTDSIGAIATGRWWRLLLCTTSKRDCPPRASRSMSAR